MMQKGQIRQELLKCLYEQYGNLSYLLAYHSPRNTEELIMRVFDWEMLLAAIEGTIALIKQLEKKEEIENERNRSTNSSR